MPKSAPKRKRRYLYAVIFGSEDRIFDFLGLDEMPVYAISDGKVSAVVSDAPNDKIRPERRHLAAHQEVLKRLMQENTPLPMSFGIIANGTKAIRNILSRNQEALLEQLNRVEGKVEMGLRVAWDVPNIFEYFLSTHPELRAARDHLFGARRKPSQEDKIELGTMFDRILNEEKENHTGNIEEVLAPYCCEIKRNKCRNEREITNLACLVGREKQAQFEASIFEAARLFDNNFVFDYNGTWAPHNFVDIDLKL
jgi:hypothetical protein